MCVACIKYSVLRCVSNKFVYNFYIDSNCNISGINVISNSRGAAPWCKRENVQVFIYTEVINDRYKLGPKWREYTTILGLTKTESD